MELINIIISIFILVSFVGVVARQAHDNEGYGWLQSIGVGVVFVIGGGTLLLATIYTVANILSIFFGYGNINLELF